MARTPRTPKADHPDESASTALVNWDEELARQAEIAAAQEANTGGGQFFSLKAGVLTFNDSALPNNEMAVIIVDSIAENVYYEEAYDPDNPVPPTCFAFGRDDSIAAHKTVFDADQVPENSPTCADCPMNQWGSADKGRGKACRNGRRLALLSAGVFKPDGRLDVIDAESLKSSQIAFMKLPPTAINPYGTFVKQVAGALKRPPHGVITKIKVVPDAKTQFRVLFEPIMNVPNSLMGVTMQRHGEAQKVIEQPYMLERDEPPAKPEPKGRGRQASAPKTAPAASGRSRKYSR